MDDLLIFSSACGTHSRGGSDKQHARCECRALTHGPLNTGAHAASAWRGPRRQHPDHPKSRALRLAGTLTRDACTRMHAPAPGLCSYLSCHDMLSAASYVECGLIRPEQSLWQHLRLQRCSHAHRYFPGPGIRESQPEFCCSCTWTISRCS